MQYNKICTQATFSYIHGKLTEDVVEEIAVIVVRFKPLVQSGPPLVVRTDHILNHISIR